MALNLPVMATILFLVPMFYFLLASPAFLLVSLGIPQVAFILRAVFAGYFFTLVGAGWIAAALFALGGRMVPALCVGLVALVDLVWRGWMLRRIDLLSAEVQAGHIGAGRPLRRLHWAGMGANAVQTALILGAIPWLAAAP